MAPIWEKQNQQPEYTNSLKTLYYMGGDLAKPKTNEKYFRVYGHMLSPFTQRVYYGIAAAGLPFQKCMVETEFCSEWHRKFNKGKIPILETPEGRLIDNSLDIISYISDVATVNKTFKIDFANDPDEWYHEIMIYIMKFNFMMDATYPAQKFQFNNPRLNK